MAGKLVTDFIQSETGTLYVQNDTGGNIFSANVNGMYSSTGTQVISSTGLGTGLIENYMNASGLSFGMRNRIINGDMRISQRGTVSLSNAIQYGPCDRFLGALAGTGVSGTLNRNTGVGTPTSSGNALWFQSFSTTNGYILAGQRIESENSKNLNGKTITITAKVWHDYGFATTFGIVINKANAVDNFSATTNLGIGTGVSIPSATWTTITSTFTLGSSDASNGIEVNIQQFDVRTVSSKNVMISDVQVEIGSVATPFEFRPYGTELALCQRYYFNDKWTVSGGIPRRLINGYLYGSTQWEGMYFYPVEMRTSPTISFSAPGTFTINNALTVSAINSYLPTTRSVLIYTGNSAGTVGYGNGLWTTATNGTVSNIEFSSEL